MNKQKWLSYAAENGFENFEIYQSLSRERTISWYEGKMDTFVTSRVLGTALRGMTEGKMAIMATEDADDANMEKKLRRLGFRIVRSKNHYIMSYFICGKELLIEVDKTPSDSRSGIKTVKDITKVIRNSGCVWEKI